MTSTRLLLLLALLLAGCTASLMRNGTTLDELYGRGAAAGGPHRNPVIVVPGLRGSRLVDGRSGRVVWGAFAGDYARPDRAEDLRLIALPMREGARLDELRDEIEPAGVLDRVKVRLLGIPLHLRAYFEILRTLGVGGYRDETLYGGDEHFTCFQFDYDWRRDNVESAQRLHEFILAKRRYVQGELRRRYGQEAPDLKFDLVAHSMGALVARYYLRYGAAGLPEDGSAPELTWAGAVNIARVVFVGPPNAGTLESVEQLVKGKDFGPFVARYPAALLGTFPAGYQMLPRQRHGMLRVAGESQADPFDPDLWRAMGWGLAAPEADKYLEWMLPNEAAPARRRIALDHQSKLLRRARHFVTALDAPATPPAGTSFYLIAGDSISTPRTASVDRATGRPTTVTRAPGDGKVLRSSALLDERLGGVWVPELQSPIAWERALFLGGTHLGLTRDPVFTDNLLYWLLEEPR